MGAVQGKVKCAVYACGHHECPSLPPSLIGEFWKRNQLESSGQSCGGCPQEAIRLNQLSLAQVSAPGSLHRGLQGLCGGPARSTWPTASFLRTLLLQDGSLSAGTLCLVAVAALAALDKPGYLSSCAWWEETQWVIGVGWLTQEKGQLGRRVRSVAFGKHMGTWVNAFKVFSFPCQFNAYWYLGWIENLE